MRRSRNEGQGGFWQSFADLAMGLMAVFALVLVLLLWAQTRQNSELRQEREKLVRHRDALALERSRFALELVSLLDAAHRMVRDQDGAEAWLRALFRESDCLLDLSADGVLRRVHEGGAGAADLYPLGETRMDLEGEAALRSCRENFLRLAYCLSPDSNPDTAGSALDPERVRRCGVLLEEDGLRESDARVVEGLRRGLEALVLQGNTDRTPVTSRRMDRIAAVGAAPVQLSSATEAFVGNAHLGAERARQALGHLLGLVQAHDEDERDALQVLMSRVRVESPSFGRYQAGPRDWRDGSCGDAESCAAARNLSLRLRWKKDELRRPYETIRARLCALLADEESALSQGLFSLRNSPEAMSEILRSAPGFARGIGGAELDPAKLRARLGCKEGGSQ